MSKRVKNLKWETVPLEGIPTSITDNLDGFVGLEECTTYGLDKETRRPKKKKPQIKRKNESGAESDVMTKKLKISNETNDILVKNVKLINGFIVEPCGPVKPSQSNVEINNSGKWNENQKATVKSVDKTSKTMKSVENSANTKMNKVKLGDDISETKHVLSAEDMLTWAEFKLPEPILKALAELGFKQPTKIQQLSLPAAIHGRRDILGAAETGSGKTLAFGLPILTGIMKLKEKADMGLDVYEIPFKKSSAKKKVQKDEPISKPSNKKNRIEKKEEGKAKESSEDGYGSGEESNNDDDDDDAESDSDDEESDSNDEDSDSNDENNDNYNEKLESDKVKTNKVKKLNNNDKVKYKNDKTVNKDGKKVNEMNETMCKQNNKTKKVEEKRDEKYLEEIVVPIKKKEASTDEGNDSDDSDDNYIHLSEMLDSDDLADSSSDENDDSMVKGDEKTDESANENNDDESADDEISGDENSSKETGDVESYEESGDEENDEESRGGDSDGESGNSENVENIDNKGGIGCVKVIDDVEMPEPTVVKTGKPLYALILTPTRELAIQISRHLTAVAKYTGIQVATIVGGMAAVKQERMLRRGPEVVVGTPGRLWELITQGQPHLQQLECVKFLAIDETDRMIERDHFEELTPLLERLNADDSKRGSRQNFVFSATLTMVHDLPAHMRGKKVTKRGKIINRHIKKMTPQQKIKRLVDMIGMTEPKVVDITQQNLGTAETLTECRITCSKDHKDAYLYYVLKRHPGRAIVFCNAINTVKRLAQLFTILKCRPLPLHAQMEQRQRLKNLERFRDDPHGVLIATDVAARGLDIPNVDHVIHYQVPRTAENYVHRSGRTARANKEGLTILMMEPDEAYLYSKICHTLNKTSEVPIFPVAPQTLAPIRELVSIARDIEALELRKRRTAQAIGWREKAAKEMDMIVDEDDIPIQKADPAIEKALRVKRRDLNILLSRPIIPKGFSYKYPTLNDPNALSWNEDDALQVMKKAIESGELKKEKRKGKNAPLLKLEKELRKK